MQKILLKMNLNNSLGGMAEQTGDFLFYSFILRGRGLTPTTKIDIERVNIRP